MSRKKLFLPVFLAGFLCLACQSNESAGSNNTAAAVPNSNTSANIPPEFSGTPTVMTTSVPGIPLPSPANQNTSNSAIPIPGISDSKTAGKPMPKNTPPIPGIPTEAELKKQMNTRISNSKIMETKPPIREPDSAPVNKPRKNDKP